MPKTVLRAFTFIFPVFFIFQNSAFAQRTLIYEDPEQVFVAGHQLFQKEKYAASQEFFRQILNHPQGISRVTLGNAAYFNAVAALELFQDDAEYLLQYFQRNFPDNQWNALANFQLGRFYFRKNKFDKAIASFNKTNTDQLNSEEWFEFKFKRGYSYFNIDKIDKAKIDFADIKDKKHIFQNSSIYYYAHISYRQQNLETALQHFLRLKDDKNFNKLTPYYISQIYFMQGNYRQAIDYSKPLADSTSGKYIQHVIRVLAESYYKLNEYENAINYYILYSQKAGGLEREAIYRLGMSYFKMNDCENATKNLKEVATEQDSLSQNALYHMGDCFIKMGLKKLALDAFKLAHRYDFNSKITEDALFNFAKLSYDLSYSPYNEAIAAFELYFEKYPNSPRKDEAYDYLIQMFINSKNYKNALEAIDRMKQKPPKIRAAYQRIAYFRGIELFNNLDFINAIEAFELAKNTNVDRYYNAAATFWKAESQYRLKNYEKSAETYQTFLTMPGALETDFYAEAHYNLAYSYFKMKNYSAAAIEFRKYIDRKDADPRKRNDALIRTGDCYFVERNFPLALEFYNRASEILLVDGDYTILQKAIIQGLLGRHQDKLNTLTMGLEKYPKSSLTPEMMYEKGTTQQRIGNDAAAIKTFGDLVERFPVGTFNRKAYLRLGLIYFNQEKDEIALANFKKVAENYPGTEESKEALKYIRNIYVEAGNIDEFTSYASTLKNVEISRGSLDSATYQAAENRFLKKDFEKAIEDFEKYIKSFPNGAYLINAHYFLAESYENKGNLEKAVEVYQYVYKRPANNFTENALRRSSILLTELKQYEKVIPVSLQLIESAETQSSLLIARRNLLKAYSQLKDCPNAVKYAEIILKEEKLDANLEQDAEFVIADCAYEAGEKDKALGYFKKLASKPSQKGAIAKYMVGLILFEKREFKESEKRLLEYVSQLGNYPNEMAKSIILLSDIYLEYGNFFQAKASLKSVIDHHKGDDLVNLAKRKLENVEAIEQGRRKREMEDNFEINFQD